MVVALNFLLRALLQSYVLVATGCAFDLHWEFIGAKLEGNLILAWTRSCCNAGDICISFASLQVILMGKVGVHL